MLGATLDVQAYLQRLETELRRINVAEMQRWADHLYGAWENDGFVFIFGNGGCGTTAAHKAEERGKSTLTHDNLKDEYNKPLKVLSLTHNAARIMAVVNDLAYDQIFVHQLMNYGRQGAMVIAISRSRNSPNVRHAVDWANR